MKIYEFSWKTNEKIMDYHDFPRFLGRVKVQVRTPEKMADVRPDASCGDGVCKWG